MVEYARFPVGLNVAVVPVYVPVPVTPPLKVNMAVGKVEVSIVSLNVAVIAVFTATPVAPLPGSWMIQWAEWYLVLCLW